MSKNLKTPILIVSVALIFSGLLFVRGISATSEGVVTSVKISICGNGIKEGGEQCDTGDFDSKSCLSLGYNSGSLSCSIACEYETSSCVSNAKKTKVLSAVSHASGAHNSVEDDGRSLSITLPSNFHAKDARVDMFLFDNEDVSSDKPNPSGKSFVGKVYDIEIVDIEGQQVTTIAIPSTIILAYSDDDVSGLDESTINPYHWIDATSSWQIVSGEVRDTVNNTITFTTSSFSFYTLMGEPLVSASESSTSVATGGRSGGFAPKEPALLVLENDILNFLHNYLLVVSTYYPFNMEAQAERAPRLDTKQELQKPSLESEQTSSPQTQKKNIPTILKPLYFIFELVSKLLQSLRR